MTDGGQSSFSEPGAFRRPGAHTMRNSDSFPGVQALVGRL